MKEKKKRVKPEGGSKWAVWKTIVIVFSSVIAVVGATVLGIYATGGLNTENVAPADISFVLDENLYNSSTNQFEISGVEQFSLTITSSTEYVTETEIELSFTGYSYEIPADGLISDRVITIPKNVTLGKPFTVTLNKSQLNDGTYWITGGISNLVAKSKSSNHDLREIRTRIAVDVPVYSTTTVLCDRDGKALGKNEVVVNSDFTAKTIFYPE